jgi:hypothetical protein
LDELDTAELIRRALPVDPDGVSVPWLVERTGLSRSVVYYHLGRQRWAVKVRAGRYRRAS